MRVLASAKSIRRIPETRPATEKGDYDAPNDNGCDCWPRARALAQGIVTGTGPGRPSHTDNAFADGNVVQLTPSTVVTVNGREVPLEALTPGSNIILESMAPTTRNGRHTNSAIPSFRDRYGGPGGPAKRRDHTFRMAVATAAVAPAALPPPHHAGLDVQLARDLRQGFFAAAAR